MAWVSLRFLICKMATVMTLQAKVLTLSEPFINVCSRYGYKQLNKLDFPDPFTYPFQPLLRSPCPSLGVTPPPPALLDAMLDQQVSLCFEIRAKLSCLTK